MSAESCLDRVAPLSWMQLSQVNEVQGLGVAQPSSDIKLEFQSLCLSCCDSIDLLGTLVYRVMTGHPYPGDSTRLRHGFKSRLLN